MNVLVVTAENSFFPQPFTIIHVLVLQGDTSFEAMQVLFKNIYRYVG